MLQIYGLAAESRADINKRAGVTYGIEAGIKKSDYLLTGNKLLLQPRWAVLSLRVKNRFCYKGTESAGHSGRMWGISYTNG